MRTLNLLEDTPWLSALREGLPVRLQYRLEVWRSREGWLDEVDRTVEWTVVVRHEPLLDQFAVTRLGPGRVSQTRRAATAGGLAGMLSLPFQVRIGPRTPGRYYYTASLDVTTLSDSDLEKFERLLRGELQGDNGGGLTGGPGAAAGPPAGGPAHPKLSGAVGGLRGAVKRRRRRP